MIFANKVVSRDKFSMELKVEKVELELEVEILESPELIVAYENIGDAKKTRKGVAIGYEYAGGFKKLIFVTPVPNNDYSRDVVETVASQIYDEVRRRLLMRYPKYVYVVIDDCKVKEVVVIYAIEYDYGRLVYMAGKNGRIKKDHFDFMVRHLNGVYGKGRLIEL